MAADLFSKEEMDAEPAVPAEDSSQPEPIRKEAANYRPAKGPDSCESCKHFIPPEGCSRVLGQISASGVSDLYEPKDTEELLSEGVDEFLFSGVPA